MISALIEGLFTGLAMLIFIGPVFFTLIQASLQLGQKAGFAIAFGIFISDVLCVILCYFGISNYFTNESNQFWIGATGSIILFVLGIKYIFFPNLKSVEIDKLSNKSIFTLFSKGFLVNFVNPFVFFVWIGIISYANEKYTSNSEIYIFLIAALVTILITDTSKALIAQYIKKYIQPLFLIKLFKIIGFILIMFAIRMLFFII